MKEALVFALRPAVRTLAQALAAGLTTLTVASFADFSDIPRIAAILAYSALLASLAAFLQNFSEKMAG